VEIQRQTGLPASIMVAQCALETGYGQYIIKNQKTGQNTYNLFCIKGEGPAGTVLITTLEYKEDKLVTVDSYFKAYHSYEESFADYVSVIFRNSRYEPAIAVANNPEKYARQLQACGYATDPTYASKLIKIAEKWNLFERVEALIKEQEEAETEKMQTLSDWAVASVEKAKKAGIMVGYGNGIWNPHVPVTREMLAVILERLGLLNLVESANRE